MLCHITSTPNDRKTQLCSIIVSLTIVYYIIREYIYIFMCSTIILPFLYIKIQFLDIMYQSDMLLTGYLYALNHSIGCMKLYNHVIVVIISRSRSVVVVLSLYNQGVWQYKIGW